jgi:hypothetical protein
MIGEKTSLLRQDWLLTYSEEIAVVVLKKQGRLPARLNTSLVIRYLVQG